VTPAPARAARRASPAPAPAPVVEEPAEEELYEEDAYYEEEPGPNLFNNPFVLAGVVVLGAIMLAVIVVLFFGRGGTDTPGTADATRTPTATVVDANGSPVATGLAARSIAVATVREGPALSYLELGTLPKDQDVDIVGRNEEATWYQIVFPFGTQLKGWVPDSALNLPDNVTSVVDVTQPTPVTRPELPTSTPVPEVVDTPTPVPTAPTTPTGADIAVVISSDCTSGSEISVTISNNGTQELSSEPIEVVVSNDGIVQYQRSFEADMAVGASASLDTGVPAEPSQMAVSVVLSNLDDINASNNISGCTVQGSGNGGGGGGGNNNRPTPRATQHDDN
jgi:hypothetical protein